MIPDFPEAKKQIKKVLDDVLREKVRQNAPVLSMINKRTLHEGDKMGVVHPDGRHVVSELKQVHSEFSVHRDEIPTLKPEDIDAKVTAVAKDMAGQMERGLFQVMDESTKESGNVITGHPELTPDSLLIALDKISIDFEDDDRSKPVRPSLITSSDGAKKLQEKIEQSTEVEKAEYKKKEDAIFDKKFQEHLADLESRKIID